jgi:FMN-dependent NADH-azoreductase
MPNILSIISSPRSGSVSTLIADDLVERLVAATPGATQTRRDLSLLNLPHIDDLFTQAIRKPAADRSQEETAAVTVSDELIAELLAADTIVVSTGLINFNIYSTLKSWIDNIARAGATFRYTENGPVGLATARKAYIVLASGGVYSTGPAAPLNHAVPYLKSVLGFVGINDVETVYVEGLAFGDEAAAKSVEKAREENARLATAA